MVECEAIKMKFSEIFELCNFGIKESAKFFVHLVKVL